MPQNDVPLGANRWLTVVGPGEPDGVELLLEPDEHPAAQAYKRALVEDGIPATPMGPVVVATIDDSCGNLIQLTSPV